MMEISSLVLRRPVDFDADEILELALDPEVRRWNPLRSVTDLESARTWCRESGDWDVGDHASWIAIDGSTGVVVATCAIFDISLTQGTAGIGYRVAAPARRQGVAKSCVDAVTQWAYEDYDLTRVQLAHSVENLASCNVARSAGYAAEGTLRSSYVDIMGVRHDEHIHGRLRTDAASTAPIPVRLDP